MKTTVKIVILALSLLVAIGGIMVFEKTIVEPPKALKQVDSYAIELEKNLGLFNQSLSVRQQDSLWLQIMDKIYVFAGESKLTDEIFDHSMDRLWSLYAPLFIDRSFHLFKQSQWDERDHLYMLNVIDLLRQAEHSDGSKVLVNTQAESLRSVEQIISTYRQAKALCSQTNYMGIANARQRIQKAEQYAKDKWLSYCISLVNDLKQLKREIGQSHYHFIESKVEELSRYGAYTEESYMNTLVPQVNAVVLEYDEQAQTLYDSKLSVDGLWSRARSYYDQAIKYYVATSNL